MSKNHIILYSKFSEYSKRFIEIINSSGVNLNLTYLCVDNPEARQRVISSKDINIKNLPCLLIVYNNGNVEKCEGENCFVWINDIIQQNNQVLLQQQQLIDMQTKLEQTQQMLDQQKPKKTVKVKQEEYEDDDDEIVTVSPPKKIKKISSKKQTRIIDSEDDEDENLVESSFGEEENPFESFESLEKENLRQDIYKDQEISAKKKNNNKLDIKSVMSQLKKDREQVDESTFPDIKKKPPGQRD